MNQGHRSSMYAREDSQVQIKTQHHSPSSSMSRSASPRAFYATISSSSGNDRVRDALNERARGIQQLGFKTILKVWIKAICPKKQAKFPYKIKEGEVQKIPGWWPNTDECRFLEPDHINKNERMTLCFHLLTLRPSPEQLEEWNEGSPSHPTLINKGWTAFLMEHAGPSIFDGENGASDERNPQRKDLLLELYQVAAEVESAISSNTRKRSRDASSEPGVCSMSKRVKCSPACDSPMTHQETVPMSVPCEPLYPSQRIMLRPQAHLQQTRERAASMSMVGSGLPQSALQMPASFSQGTMTQRHSISHHPDPYHFPQAVVAAPPHSTHNNLATTNNMMWRAQSQQPSYQFQNPTSFTTMPTLPIDPRAQVQDAELFYPAQNWDSFTQAAPSSTTCWETPREPSLTPSSIYSQTTTACISPRRTSLEPHHLQHQQPHGPIISLDSPSPMMMPIGLDSKPAQLASGFESPMMSHDWLSHAGEKLQQQQQQDLPSASMMEQGSFEYFSSVEDGQQGSWQDVYYSGHV